MNATTTGGGDTAAAAPRRYAVRWAQLPGLRGRLLLQAAQARAAPLALLCGLHYVAAGRLSWWAAGVYAALTLAVQAAAHAAASLPILPAQRRTCDTVSWLAEHKLLNRLMGGAAREHLAPLVSMLGAMRSSLGPLREGLLGVPGVERLALRTPDGVVLDGVIARDAAGGGRRPAILYLGGNGEHYEFRADLLLSAYRRRGYAVALVNYRGVGCSGGTASRDGAVVDAASALAYLVHGCGYDPRQVAVLGHSIGGAFAAEAARAFPGVLVISDRSFANLSGVALYQIAPEAVEGPAAVTWVGTAARWAVRALIRHVALWELDAVAHWGTLPAGSKLVAWSPADAVIPLPAQLAAALEARGADISGGGGGGGHVLGGGPASSAAAAASSPSSSSSAAGPDAVVDTAFMRLALPPLPGVSARRHGVAVDLPSHQHAPPGGEEPDAHNRAFTPDEERRLFAAIERYAAGEPLPRAI